MADEQKPPKPGFPIQTMCHALACDPRTFRNYKTLGLVVEFSRGRYNLIETIRKVVPYLREVAAGRQGKDGVDVGAANAGFKNAQTRLTELKIAQAEGRLVSIEEVEQAWSTIALAVKTTVLSLPGRARFDLPHLTGADQKVLQKLVRQALEELSLGKTAPLPDRNDDAADDPAV